MGEPDRSMGDQGSAKPQALDYAAPEPRKRISWRGAVAGGMLAVGACFLFPSLLASPDLFSEPLEVSWPLWLTLLVSLAATCVGAALAVPVWRREPRSRLEVVTTFFVCLGMLALLTWMVPEGNLLPRSQARLVLCQSNLRQIYLAMAAFAQANGGRYPDDLAEIVPLVGGPTGAGVFTCPETKDTPTTAPTTRAIGQELAAGGHLSYVYLAKGLTMRAFGDDVLLLDASPCHLKGTGVNVLYADGHVEQRPRREWMAILSQAATGVRPVTRPVAGQ